MNEKDMMDMGGPKMRDEQKVTVLDKINQALADLGSTAKWRRAPEYLKEYEPLKGKRLVMVDDMKGLLEHFAPGLMVATDGNASFIEYTGQNSDQLIEQIMQHDPDIVVMDYHLSDHLKGSSVIRSLNEQNFSGQTIGFSSDNATSKNFMAAGAKGTVKKDTGEPERSIGELANLISKE